MARARRIVGALAAAAIAAVAREGAAQGPTEATPPPQGNQSAVTRDFAGTPRPFWTSATPGPFVSSIMELGILYYRPQIAIGYGRPHWSWFGLEGNVSVSPSGGSEYAGVHAVSSILEGRFGARYAFPLNQYFLPPQRTYTRDQTEYQLGPQSRYTALEAEVAGSIPALAGNIFAVGTLYHVLGVPEPFYLFEESLRVVMRPPWMWRVRAGYLFTFGINQNLRMGGAAEVIGLPGREELVVRAGPVLGVALTHHLEAVGAVMIVARSPDSLGFQGAELGQLGLRYRWASTDRWPEFP